MLRIFLPALQVGPGLTGVGMYTQELVRAMVDQPREDLDIVVGAPHPEFFRFLDEVPGLRVEPLRLTRDDPWGRMLANHTVVPQIARGVGSDVVLAPNFVAPAWGGFETAVMVHDLAFVHFPQTTTRAKRTYYRLMVRRSVRRARRIFVSTRTVADELVEFEPLVADRIRLTPEGVAPTFLAQEDDEEDQPTAGGLRRPRGDFLFVGTLEPRKNLERLLKAHGNLCRQDPAFPALRLVGGRGWEDAGIQDALRGHPDPRRLVRLGYCGVEELKAEYDRALAFVFPSLYEGFGLPVLEAMSRGCPVLTSRGTATEEVASGAALLVDPMQVGEIEAGMARLARDLRLRSRLRRRGRARAGTFSWSRCAQLTLDGLREIRQAAR